MTIEITYNSPDTYPTYSPPNYRTASSVSLRCVTTTDSVTYRWSSTCRSDCFAYNSSLQTISEPFLRARDAGVHTCTVTDGAGNNRSNATTMNIVGKHGQRDIGVNLRGIFIGDFRGDPVLKLGGSSQFQLSHPTEKSSV